MQKVKRKRRKCRVIPKIHLNLLYNTPKAMRDKTIMAFGKDTPLRLIDVAMMRIEYIDLENGYIEYPEQMKTKTPLVAMLCPESISRVRSYIFEKLDDKSNGWMFPSKILKNKHISTRQFSTLVENIVEECGFKEGEITFHDFRATYFTRAKLSGMDKTMLSLATGTSEKTIHDRYSKFTPEEYQKCFKKIHNEEE